MPNVFGESTYIPPQNTLDSQPGIKWQFDYENRSALIRCPLDRLRGFARLTLQLRTQA
jgi:hypothetical protein